MAYIYWLHFVSFFISFYSFIRSCPECIYGVKIHKNGRFIPSLIWLDHHCILCGGVIPIGLCEFVPCHDMLGAIRESCFSDPSICLSAQSFNVLSVVLGVLCLWVIVAQVSMDSMVVGSLPRVWYFVASSRGTTIQSRDLLRLSPSWSWSGSQRPRDYLRFLIRFSSICGICLVVLSFVCLGAYMKAIVGWFSSISIIISNSGLYLHLGGGYDCAIFLFPILFMGQLTYTCSFFPRLNPFHACVSTLVHFHACPALFRHCLHISMHLISLRFSIDFGCLFIFAIWVSGLICVYLTAKISSPYLGQTWLFRGSSFCLCLVMEHMFQL